MKLKIYVKRLNTKDKNVRIKQPIPKVIVKGDWVDLRANSSITFEGTWDTVSGIQYIPLGVAMRLPKGFEAIVVPRSSTPKNFKIICPNSFGVIDNSYQGNKDEWKFPAIALAPTKIEYGDRICQFRIQLSQKASFRDKLKWLMCSGIEFVEVGDLGMYNRGGFGSTGKD